LQVKQSLINAATAYIKEIKDQKLPSFQLMEQVDAGTDNSLNGSYFPMGIVPSTSGGRRTENVSNVGVNNFVVGNLQWDFYNFGGYKANEDAAVSALKVRKSDLDQQAYFLQVATTAAYFKVLKNEFLFKYSIDAYDRFSNIKKAIHAYVQSGLRPGVDSSIANAELSKARLNILDAGKQLAIAKNELSLLTGMDTSVIKVDSSNAVLIDQWQSLQQSDSLLNHPLLNYYQSVYKNNLAYEKVIRKSNLPKLSLLSAAWMRGSSIDATDKFKPAGDAFSYNRYNYMAGLALTYNLFEGKKRADKLVVQKYQTTAALQQYSLQKDQLESANKESDIYISTALNKLNEIPVQLKAASDAYAQKLALYNSGLANIIDLVNAYYILNRAQIDEVMVKDEYWRAIFQKAYAANQFNQLLSILK
jgi:outer membrane protein TolC